MADEQMTYEDWLRGCVHHDGRNGYVTLPCDEVLKIADFIERLRNADRKTEQAELEKRVEWLEMQMDLVHRTLDKIDRKTEPKAICELCSKNPCKTKEMINDIGHWVSECTEFDRKDEPSFTGTDFGKGTITRYTELDDGTIAVKVGDATKVTRVLVEDGQNGDLYYADKTEPQTEVNEEIEHYGADPAYW